MEDPTLARVDAVKVAVEHLDDRGLASRVVEETMELRGTYRMVQRRPMVGTTNGANDVAGYLGDAAAADRDFVIGTHAVQADGNTPARLGLSGAIGRSQTFVIRNDELADGETDAADVLNPDFVGISVVDVERT